MLYCLALPENAKYQDRLRAEVSTLAQGINVKDVCDLPFLDQCLYETLRLYAPGPGSLQQRVTPQGKPTSISIRGHTYSLPPHTMIGCLAYSLHRNEEVFQEDIEIFKPERWQEADDVLAHRMRESWIPFGSGARVCIGKRYVEILTTGNNHHEASKTNH